MKDNNISCTINTMIEEKTVHWSQKKEEVSSNRPIKLLIWLVRHLPIWFVNLLIYPVSFFYFIFSKQARSESKLYQTQLIKFTNAKTLKRPNIYKHIMSFALSVIEKIEGWSGKINLDKIIFEDDDVVTLKEQLSNRKGAIIISSHLGNIEMLRSLAEYGQTGVNHYVPVTAIVNSNVTKKFNQTLKEISSKVSINLMGVDEIGPDTISILSDRIEKGGLVVMAADRTSINTVSRSITHSFLGRDANFPYGVFLIVALLKSPLYYVFAIREKTIMLSPKYFMKVKKIDVNFNCTRKEREGKIHQISSEFVKLLEKYCILYPFQWYNFFNFWN